MLKPIKRTKFVVLCAFWGAYCSLLYELVLSKLISWLAGGQLLWYSITLGSYLVGLGLGALLQSKTKASWLRLYKLELALSLLSVLSVPAIWFMHSIYF